MSRLVTALLALAPTATLAEGFACTMTTECFDADGCSDTAFAFDLTLADKLVTLTTDAETFSGALV